MVISNIQGIRFQNTGFQLNHIDLKRLEKQSLEFLAFSEIVDNQGNVFSWLNSRRSGYVYPEIMGYYLTFCCQYLEAHPGNSLLHHCLRQRTHQVARRLQRLVSPRGGIGRDGLLYLFDTAIAITGLLTYQAHFNCVIDPRCLSQMTAFVTHAVEQQQSVWSVNGDRCSLPARWSTVFGSSMIKVVIALQRLADWTGNSYYRHQGQQLAQRVMEHYSDDGAFMVFPKLSTVYTHAHCYALEGLLDLHYHGHGAMMPCLIAGADCLKQWQNQDGSLYNWNRQPHPPPTKIGDATAQAIRIWLAVDRNRYQEQIHRGFEFLKKLAAPEHGMYYGAGSSDINTWVTMFTAQALDWYLKGCRPRSVV